MSPECAQEQTSAGACTTAAIRDLGVSVAAQMDEVCDRLPVPLARVALARYGFSEG